MKKLTELGMLDQTMDIDRFKVQKLVKDGNLDISKLDGSVEKSASRTLRGSEL